MKKWIAITLLFTLLLGTVSTATAATLPYEELVDIAPRMLGGLTPDEWFQTDYTRACFAGYAMLAAHNAYPSEEVINNWSMTEGCLVSKVDSSVTCAWVSRDGDLYIVFHADIKTAVSKLKGVSLSAYKQTMKGQGYSTYEYSSAEIYSAFQRLLDQ